MITPPFDPDKLYPTDDEALQLLGPPSTLADWRSQRRGPAFCKFGKRVLYPGRALNEFLERSLVETSDSRPAEAEAEAAA